jgi:hypothetical protein
LIMAMPQLLVLLQLNKQHSFLFNFDPFNCNNMMHWCVGDINELHWVSINLSMMGFAIKKVVNNKIHGKQNQPKKKFLNHNRYVELHKHPQHPKNL